MMGQISYRQAKKPCKSRLFPVDLDAPLHEFVRTFHIENKQKC